MQPRSWLTKSCSLAILLLGPIVCPSNAQVVFDHNATIAGRYESDVHIVDGANPPTVVQIMEPAYFERSLLVEDSSIVHLLGGHVEEGLIAHDASIVDIRGGTIRNGVFAGDRAILQIAGGNFVDEDEFVTADDFSVVNIHGGTLWALEARGDAVAFLSGGTLQARLTAEESGTIFIRGTGFNYPYGSIQDASGTLTGFLDTGDAIMADFDINADGAIVLVPEPSGLILTLGAALAGAALLSRRERH